MGDRWSAWIRQACFHAVILKLKLKLKLWNIVSPVTSEMMSNYSFTKVDVANLYSDTKSDSLVV